MGRRRLGFVVIVAVLATAGCSVADTAPNEFSFDRITIANPLQQSDDK